MKYFFSLRISHKLSLGIHGVLWRLTTLVHSLFERDLNLLQVKISTSYCKLLCISVCFRNMCSSTAHSKYFFLVISYLATPVNCFHVNLFIYSFFQLKYRIWRRCASPACPPYWCLQPSEFQSWCYRVALPCNFSAVAVF